MCLRIDALIGDTAAQHREHMGEQDHHAHEHKKNHGRMGDLVADLFNPVQECLQKCSGLLARLTHEVSPLKGWSSRSVAPRMPPHSPSAFWCGCSRHSATTREGYRASAATNKPVSGLTGGEDTTGVSHLCIYMPYCAHVSTLSMF